MLSDKELDDLWDVYEKINPSDVPAREAFWGALKALGKASDFMAELTKDEENE